MTAAGLRRRRAAAQLLAGADALDPAGAVTHLLAVQAQDPRAARLALRARGAARTAAEVDAALTDDRAVVAGWLMRGTLHLVAREDYRWLLALTADQNAATIRRRLTQLGVTDDAAERAVALIERALAEDGPLPRAQLAERLRAAGLPAEGQAVPHLLALATGRGTIVLGPVRDGRHAFALTRDWLGAPDRAPDRDAALAELARRYLAGYGPATAADLAAWAGLPLRDARAGLGSIAGDVDELGGGLVDLAGRAPAPDHAPPRLLPAFDPYVLGWKDRTFTVPAEHARRVHPGGGVVRAVATVDGLAVATWSARRRGERLAVDIEPFSPLGTTAVTALQAEAADVARFEGLAPARSRTGSE
jgi:Winged helix DNA-binding domain